MDQHTQPSLGTVNQWQMDMWLNQSSQACQACATQDDRLNAWQARSLTSLCQALNGHRRIGLQHGTRWRHRFYVAQRLPITQADGQALQHGLPSKTTCDYCKRTPL